MIRTLAILVAGIALSFCGTAFAQDNQQTEEQAQSGSAATDLQVGEVVVQPTITKFDDWTVFCVKNDEGEENCRMQLVVLNDSETPIAEFEIWKITDNSELAAGVGNCPALGRHA